ncbi:dipeptidase [Galbitalea sp. SE-J8]|uniref:dipeptidase n=1 Tax=Galbitalea sp. SE-J8 TaxID=3054952 RepID=UPI00259C6C0B|nr:dipeptidase [Galbitalea sp. SE-J8]MDM4763976.1 dipeptidase [Galbitalea sp. SE-J8]
MTLLPPTPSVDSERIAEAVAAGFPAAVADLGRLVRIPSVSWDGFDPENVARSAEAVAELARATGVFDTVDIRRSRIGDTDVLGQPAVIARRAARGGRPTILLYAHHDVQPPGQDEDWESKPFEPTARGDRLYGRGSADDKAGVMSHIAAIRALVEATGPDLQVGIALYIEGEEEFASRSFSNFLLDNRDDLAADVIVVADGGNWDLDTPALTVSLRGNVTFRLTVTTLEHASHSGVFGGAVPDAMLAMTRLLASFHDERGAVAVAGLTSHEAPTPEYGEAKLREEAALLPGVSPIGTGEILERLWFQPSITVTGIDAPTVLNASNTLIPSVSVRVSVRIAPGQTTDAAIAAIRDHIARHTPFGATVELSEPDAGSPFLVDTSGWAVADAGDAMSTAYGREVVQVGSGGSIPFVADLTAVFPDAQILITGVEDPDSRAHSPNESLHLPTFRRGIHAEALLLAKLDARA